MLQFYCLSNIYWITCVHGMSKANQRSCGCQKVICSNLYLHLSPSITLLTVCSYLCTEACLLPLGIHQLERYGPWSPNSHSVWVFADGERNEIASAKHCAVEIKVFLVTGLGKFLKEFLRFDFPSIWWSEKILK